MEIINHLLSNGIDTAKQATSTPFRILPFDSKYQLEVIELIERIQVGEFNIPIDEGQRKELQSISRSFQKNIGNYWVALFNGKVIGTIAVIDIGHHAFELRDVFLDKEYRGSKTGFAKKLLDTVLSWSREHHIKTIYLGTTLAFRAAHRFYEKHGFCEIARKDMPSYCQPMDCDEKFYQLVYNLQKSAKNQIQGIGMHQIIEHQKEKFFIGLELRTNNEECSLAMPNHKDRFFKENIPSKIPNKINGNILALYTDYEGDYTKPYSWILGCEVSSLEQVPEGLVGKVIPESKYAVFTTQGKFPQGLIAAWQEVWQSGLPRSYTSDFEVYRNDFDPQRNPEVKVYIAIE